MVVVCIDKGIRNLIGERPMGFSDQIDYIINAVLVIGDRLAIRCKLHCPRSVLVMILKQKRSFACPHIYKVNINVCLSTEVVVYFIGGIIIAQRILLFWSDRY